MNQFHTIGTRGCWNISWSHIEY